MGVEGRAFLFTARYPQVTSALASWTSCLKWQAVTSAKTARQKKKQTPLQTTATRRTELANEHVIWFHLRTETAQEGHRIELKKKRPTSAQEMSMLRFWTSCVHRHVHLQLTGCRWKACIFCKQQQIRSLRGCCTLKIEVPMSRPRHEKIYYTVCTRMATGGGTPAQEVHLTVNTHLLWSLHSVANWLQRPDYWNGRPTTTTANCETQQIELLMAEIGKPSI